MRYFVWRCLVQLARWIKPRHQGCSGKGDLKDKVMAYEHPELVERLVHKLEISREEALKAFRDMKRFLFIAGTMDSVPLSPPSDLADEAWHHFMLFSKDYASFCFGFFGRFIHHQPFTREMRLADDGQGMENTATALAAEFGVVSETAKCSTDCRCRDGVEGGVLVAACDASCECHSGPP